MYEVIALLRASYIRSFMANCCIRKCGKKKHWRHRVRRKHNTTRTRKSTRSCICILPRIETGIAWDGQWFRRKSTPSTRWLRLSLSLPLYICISMGVGIGNTFRAVFHLHWVGWACIWWFAVLHTASREKIHGAQEWGGCQHYHLVLQRDGRKVVFI